ncbi:MAG: lysophospholipid acyltransferase family protein [Candidatus Omnitrophica bacterium]|nr:lysophospholipid acyltransferase family protein [Candidatus Omnitrophota bacterium]
MFFYLLYKLGYFLSNALPLEGAYRLAEKCSDLQYALGARDREAVVQNLSIVLKKDIKECRILASKVFRSFGMYLVDFFRMSRLTREEIDKRVRIIGLENIDRALKKNKGVIVLTCHIGNWEMGGVIMGTLGYDISAVVLVHKHKNINNFFIRQREEKGLKVIAVNSIMKRCISTLSNNGILALAGDRDFTNSGVKLNFFGIPTSIPKGPAALSLKTGAPVVPGFLIREGRSNYKFIFGSPIEVELRPGVSKDETVKKATEIFVSAMEDCIRQYPEQWLVFRRFWEDTAGAVVL